MLDSDDCMVSLGNLFFEKPTVNKINPLQYEVSPWQLDAPPSLSQIPATQVMQEEAESLCSLYGFTQKPKKFLPSSKGSAGLNVLPSKINSLYSYTDDEKEIEAQGGSSSRCDGLWGGEGFSDFSPGACESGRGGDETPQDPSHVAISRRWLSLHPPLRRSLFKVQVLNNGGVLSNADEPSSNSSRSQTASRPQTFLSQVTMATAPPPPPPPPPPLPFQPPRATVSQAAPPFSPKPPFSPPPSGSSAANSRPLQQAAHAELQDKGTKRAFVPPMTPQPLRIQGSSESGVLRPVSEIPAKFRSVFSNFPFFNYIQSKALDDVLYSDRNFVACAPTGSGKTVLFELAIIRLLMETSEPWRDVKAVYMAPIKALCSQCFESWKTKFGPLGLICKELTGDTQIDDLFEIQDSHIILTTPEKWDSLTRQWKDNCLLQLVRLFLIDEVHVVKDETRGATLEVVVSRMKAVHAYRAAQNPEDAVSMRFVAASATMPNVCDIADWLSNESGPATYLEMDESHRPVKLRKVVLGFPCSPNQTEFKFDLSLNYKMANIIQTYSDQKPVLVFCSTRKGAQQSAAVLAKDAHFIMSIEHKQRLMKYANSILDSKLRGESLLKHKWEEPSDLVMLGVGFHHAGVEMSDRKLIENAFTVGDLPILFTTRTLAMGVNLPAHLVVIKSTMQYVSGACEEYSEADLLQMIGRAGRPQFDTSATAVIMTKLQTRDKYMKIMNGVEIIESSLHTHLVEHLNAEIVLQTISDVNMALDWIRSTLLYIRALKNPTHYGFPADLDRHGIEAKLQELCLRNLNSLSSLGLISMDEDINIKPTEVGRLMARYCVAFDTMKQFSKVAGNENLSDLIELVSKSKEFSDVQLRVNEKRTLNTLNRDKNRITIRFPMDGKIKNSEMKVNCLIQAQLGSISVQEFGLTQDTARIFRNGMRISKCLSECLSQTSKAGFSAVLNSLILAKCFRAKLWENSPYVSKQLEKIGQTLSTAMVNAGLTNLSKIEQTNPRELELILNRHPPFGNQIRESVTHLPKYEVTLEQLPRYSYTMAEIVVKVNLKNQPQLLSRRTAPDYHYVSLIIGDSDNSVVFQQKLTDAVLLKCGSWSKKFEVAKASKGEEISVHLISSDYVGLDIQQKFSVFFSRDRKYGTGNPYNKSWTTTGQRATNSTHEPQRAEQIAAQRQNDAPATEPVLGNKRQCNHFCKNKDQCGHDCCKVGVTVARKRSANQESSFLSYLNNLKSRDETLTQTPVKRLKIRMSHESASVNMQEFLHKPKERLPSACSHGGRLYESAERAHSEIVDLTGEHCAQQTDTVHLDSVDSDYEEYLVDKNRMEEPFQTPAASQARHQMGLNTGVSIGVTQKHKPLLNQITLQDSAQSKKSTSVSNRGARCESTSHPQMPTVNFDLGNEWDDWGDFDEENLVHASETSSWSTQAKPRVQQPVEWKMPGITTAPKNDHVSYASYTATAAPEYLGHSQVQPCVAATTRPPLRSISPTLSPEIRKPEASTPVAEILQKRVTLEWNKKRQNIFSEELKVKTPERVPKQHETYTAPAGRRFDFFSTLSNKVETHMSANQSSYSKEEEAFIGIFDGII